MEENKNVAYDEPTEGIVIDYEKGVKNPLLKNRRYVGQKERIGYLLNDVAASFNISKYNDRFIYDVVKLDFHYLAIGNTFVRLYLDNLLSTDFNMKFQRNPKCFFHCKMV